jgi:hypothetical protein
MKGDSKTCQKHGDFMNDSMCFNLGGLIWHFWEFWAFQWTSMYHHNIYYKARSDDSKPKFGPYEF